MEGFLCANYFLSCLQFSASLLFWARRFFTVKCGCVWNRKWWNPELVRVGSNLHRVSDDSDVCSLEYFAHMFQLCIHNICKTNKSAADMRATIRKLVWQFKQAASVFPTFHSTQKRTRIAHSSINSRCCRMVELCFGDVKKKSNWKKGFCPPIWLSFINITSSVE